MSLRKDDVIIIFIFVFVSFFPINHVGSITIDYDWLSFVDKKKLIIL